MYTLGRTRSTISRRPVAELGKATPSKVTGGERESEGEGEADLAAAGRGEREEREREVEKTGGEGRRGDVGRAAEDAGGVEWEEARVL